jgi:hypothetical protein
MVQRDGKVEGEGVRTRRRRRRMNDERVAGGCGATDEQPGAGRSIRSSRRPLHRPRSSLASPHEARHEINFNPRLASKRGDIVRRSGKGKHRVHQSYQGDGSTTGLARKSMVTARLS